MHAFDEDIAPSTRAGAADHDTPGRRHIDGAFTSAGPAPGSGLSPPSLLSLQRQAGNLAVVQLLREGDGDGDPHGLGSLLGGGGSPLDAGTRIQMESAIGADFSDVRVHTGSDADASAKSLGAHAYTAGNDIVFANGRYDPDSSDGQHTLAHELTHVVQQRSGPVDGTVTDTGVKVSDPSDSFERAAEANADRVTSLQQQADPAGRAATTGSAPAPAPAVQRHGDDEIQGMFVQREADDEADDTVQALSADTAVQREADDDEE
jgi:hypothetical protein